jgi:hypothetical protein|tara:strand:+ start:418 stop:582 length:165 start_codon:yes stop_codon:yes gene_type:complete
MKETLIIRFLKPYQYKDRKFKVGSELDLITIADSPFTAMLAANNLVREGLAIKV